MGFIYACFGNGFTCTLEGLTPNLDRLGSLEGAARARAARALGIGSTTLRAEQQSRDRWHARMASDWPRTPRVASGAGASKARADAERERAVEQRTREIIEERRHEQERAAREQAAREVA